MYFDLIIQIPSFPNQLPYLIANLVAGNTLTWFDAEKLIEGIGKYAQVWTYAVNG